MVVGQVISLASVSRRDRGAYLCIASNGVPPAVSHRISLEVGPGHNISSDTTLSLPQVVFPPSLALDQDTAVARPGANLRLGCSVEAVPEPVMSWATNNRAITKGGHTIIIITLFPLKFLQLGVACEVHVTVTMSTVLHW